MSMYNIYIEGQQAEEHLKKRFKEKYYEDQTEEQNHNAKRRLEEKHKDPSNRELLKKAHDKYVDMMASNAAKGQIERLRVSKGTGDEQKAEQYRKKNWRDVDNKAIGIEAIANHMKKHPEAYKEQGIFAECVLI